MFDERAGDNAAPKLSGGLSLGPLSSRRIQVSVCGRAMPERHICGLQGKGFQQGPPITDGCDGDGGCAD
jgi:hypothetical protein